MSANCQIRSIWGDSESESETLGFYGALSCLACGTFLRGRDRFNGAKFLQGLRLTDRPTCCCTLNGPQERRRRRGEILQTALSHESFLPCFCLALPYRHEFRASFKKSPLVSKISPNLLLKVGGEMEVCPETFPIEGILERRGPLPFASLQTWETSHSVEVTVNQQPELGRGGSISSNWATKLHCNTNNKGTGGRQVERRNGGKISFCRVVAIVFIIL